MIPHALRRTSILLLATWAAVSTLVLVAGPALAAEGEATSEASGFGSGQWDGMVLAAIGGFLLGLLVFALSSPGEIHRDTH